MNQEQYRQRYLERNRIAFGQAGPRDQALKAWRLKWGVPPPERNTAMVDMVTSLGSAVKAIGSGRVEGYLLRYGGKGDLSAHRDVFLKSPGTDYGRRKTSDAYVHHGLLPGLGERMLTNEAQLEQDEIGVFCKLLLDIGDKYEAALYQLTAAGKLGWSSGTLPNLVKRVPNSDGSHTIKRWILGGDASLTPSPAGGMGMRASASMKSLLLDVGVDITRPTPGRRQEQPNAVLAVGPTSGSHFDPSDHWGLSKMDIKW